jgi:hypothetical protein
VYTIPWLESLKFNIFEPGTPDTLYGNGHQPGIPLLYVHFPVGWKPGWSLSTCNGNLGRKAPLRKWQLETRSLRQQEIKNLSDLKGRFPWVTEVVEGEFQLVVEVANAFQNFEGSKLFVA